MLKMVLMVVKEGEYWVKEITIFTTKEHFGPKYCLSRFPFLFSIRKTSAKNRKENKTCQSSVC